MTRPDIAPTAAVAPAAPEPPPLPLPLRPQLATHEEERRHRKQRLAAAIRLFGKYGYGEGISGHLSVRDPEHLDRFWVNPFGVSFTQVRVADLLCVDSGGRVVEGRHPLNPSAFVIHSHIHDSRPDAEAAALGHTANSRALGALGQLLEPIDQESAAFYERQVLYRHYLRPAVDDDQGAEIAAHLGDSRAMLLAHHGLVTVGGSIDEAAHWFFTYESCAQVQLLAQSAGTMHVMDTTQACAARDGGFGSPRLGWFSFQLLWEEIVQEQPDLLEE